MTICSPWILKNNMKSCLKKTNPSTQSKFFGWVDRNDRVHFVSIQPTRFMLVHLSNIQNLTLLSGIKRTLVWWICWILKSKIMWNRYIEWLSVSNKGKALSDFLLPILKKKKSWVGCCVFFSSYLCNNLHEKKWIILIEWKENELN